ncbi:hypothetical protein ACQP2E_19155 [Actinoplanes sp. CA-015351]|uniref:hypothetical protein n=1 Tax=Actinoplanes sp. CA-015351 TaxID=3239897 RepID=UPI003D9691B9
MAQLSLFPTRHLRDRTLRRNYSAATEEFRREHERHRSWGLAQRHARKLRRLRDREDGGAASAEPVPGASDALSAPAQGLPALPTRATLPDSMSRRDASSPASGIDGAGQSKRAAQDGTVRQDAEDQRATTQTAEPSQAVARPPQPDPAEQTGPAEQPKPAEPAEQPKPAEPAKQPKPAEQPEQRNGLTPGNRRRRAFMRQRSSAAAIGRPAQNRVVPSYRLCQFMNSKIFPLMPTRTNDRNSHCYRKHGGTLRRKANYRPEWRDETEVHGRSTGRSAVAPAPGGVDT